MKVRSEAIAWAVTVSATLAFTASARAEDLVIGAVGSMTGVAAAFDKAVIEGVQAYIKVWDDKGGFRGHRVTLELLDDESNSATAVTVYRKLVEDKEVNVIIAASPSQTLLAIKAIADDYGVPTIGSATVVQLAVPPAKYFFRSLPGTDAYMQTLIDWVKAHGWKKIAILNPSDAAGQSEAGLIKDDAAAAGIEIVAAEKYNSSDTNFTAQLVNIRNAKPDFFYCGIIGGPSVTVFKQVKQLHLTMPIALHSSAFNPNFYGGIGGEAEAEGVYSPVERGGMAGSADGVSGDLYKEAGEAMGHPATNLNTAGWDTAMVVAHAIEISDGSREGIRQALEKTKDLPVIGGFISFGPTDHRGKDERSVGIGQLRGGHFIEAK
jgi:branched-chain amino acid transport system substrate-binding protein